MHIADAVLSGGVRRAAVICMFSLSDDDMMNAKTGNWFIDNPQRARSNNSVMLKRDSITWEEFQPIMQQTREFGEPGFLFVDDFDILFNPCVEIGLYPFFEGQSSVQGCNLTEINGSKCTSKEQFLRACRLSAILGTLQAGYTDFKFLPDHVKKTFDREALLGCSVTGWMNSPDVLLDKDTLTEGAQIIKDVNRKVAKMIGINPAARTTCVKPSGNTSALFGTASNTGGEHAKRYIRNAQYNKISDVAQLIENTNPAMVEESVWSATNSDVVVSYPVTVDDDNRFPIRSQRVKHLEIVKFIQEHWVQNGKNPELCVNPATSHNVSNTITVDDWDAVAHSF
jgi:ribonucleoside-triphosphate reductase